MVSKLYEATKLIISVALIIQFQTLLKGVVLRGDMEPPTETQNNFYNRVQVDALLNAGFEVQFSVDGGANWHKTQTNEDLFYRFRNSQTPNANWSLPIKLIVGPQGEKGDTGDPLLWENLTPVQKAELRVNPNLLINGNFKVWQRGKNFVNDANIVQQITADRWWLWTNHNVGDVSSIIKNNDHVIMNKTAGTGYSILYQRVDIGFLKPSTTYTFTVEAAVPVGKNISLRVRNSGLKFDKQQPINGTATKAIYSVNFTTPQSLAAGGLFFEIMVWLSSNTSIKIYRTKLEKGDKFTGFTEQNYALDLLECQRYYQVLSYNVYVKQDYVRHAVTLFTPMRAIPTIALLSGDMWEGAATTKDSFAFFFPASATSKKFTCALSAEL